MQATIATTIATTSGTDNGLPACSPLADAKNRRGWRAVGAAVHVTSLVACGAAASARCPSPLLLATSWATRGGGVARSPAFTTQKIGHLVARASEHYGRAVCHDPA